MDHFLFLGQWLFHLVNQSVLLLVGLLDGGALGGLPRILGFFTLGSLGSQLRGFGAGIAGVGWLVFRGVWLDVGVFLLLLLWTVLFFWLARNLVSSQFVSFALRLLLLRRGLFVRHTLVGGEVLLGYLFPALFTFFSLRPALHYVLLQLAQTEFALAVRTELGFLFTFCIMTSVEESFSQKTAKLALLSECISALCVASSDF